ncbi:MAG: hypothetical protein ACI841_001847 [Planctomycetota bacterium]|jgi:hypothetical protein
MNLRLFPIAILLAATTANAQNLRRVTVTAQNLAPIQGTFQTPVWVGFHDGNFDIYDSGVAASGVLGGDTLERIAEDGNFGPLSTAFLSSATGTVNGALFGPAGPIAPGEAAVNSFLLDPTSPSSRYFSYTSMVIPSNDAFVANGNGQAHMIFDGAGNFVGQPFFVTGSEVLDAGTEVNDELPMNTAFLGQMMPNTGMVEAGVVGPHPGFNMMGTGGILDNHMFMNGMFLPTGYSMIRIAFKEAPAITDFRHYRSPADASQEVHAVTSNARGRFLYQLQDMGTKLTITSGFRATRNLTGIHLHMASAGQNGPLVASLVGPLPAGGGNFVEVTTVEITAADLRGPLRGYPLDRLMADIEAGNIYVNVHTDDGLPGDDTGAGDYSSGELRGQLERF